MLAKRLELIKPSPSVTAMSRANELIAAGHDICNLAGGEPDFETPAHIIEGASEAMRRGATKYTSVDGTKALKEAIVEKFRRENGLNYETSQISVGAGAKQIIFNAITCSVNDGDEAIIPAPYWVSYPDIVRFNGGLPVFVTTSAAQDFKITPDQLRKALTPRTKWLFLNSPNNPTGSTYTSSELAALGRVLREHPDVLVLTDDIYEHIRYDDSNYTSFATANPDLFDRTLTINGVSKAYSMTGFRIGYAGGPQPLIKAMAMLQSQNSGNPASVSQAAALTALKGGMNFFPAWLAEYRQRRDYVVSHLNAVQGLSCPTPQGAFYVYVGCEEVIGKTTPSGARIGNDSDVVMYLLNDHGVATVQGAAYGVSPAFRISFATSLTTLEKACARIAAACAALR
jgi:aspartate aminotransferase